MVTRLPVARCAWWLCLALGLHVGAASAQSSTGALRGRDPRIIPAKPGGWALVWGPWESGGWTDIRLEPAESAERLGQALLGDRVKVCELRGGWVLAQEMASSWRGWIRADQLTYGSRAVREAVKGKAAAVISTSPGIRGDGVLVPFGARLPVLKDAGAHKTLLLPDGRQLVVQAADLVLERRRMPMMFAVEHAHGLLRRPFQAGANSPEAIDAVGLVYLLLRVSGLDVPRDPGSLWRAAAQVRPAAKRPGDILLFERFGDQGANPVVLVNDQTVLEASPAGGVNFLQLDQMSQRRLLKVLRFTELPAAQVARTMASARSSKHGDAEKEGRDGALLWMALSHQAVLVLAILLLRIEFRRRADGQW